MDFDVKKLENCFADAENYEYRVTASGEQLRRLLVSEQKAEVRVNERLRRPVFIATLPNGVRVKGELAGTVIRVGYEPDVAAEQKTAFESWLRAPRPMNLRTAAILPVAGLSSRMGEFKPLLTLNGFAMIRLAAQSALDGGVLHVCVVTGRESERVCDALADVDEGVTPPSAQPLMPSPPSAPPPTPPSPSAPFPTTTPPPIAPTPPTALLTALAPVPSTSRVVPTAQQPLLRFVHNPDFATTDMLHSLKLGLRALLESEQGGGSGEAPFDAIFVLPADVATVTPRSFGRLRDCAEHSDAAVFHPTFRGQKGHPLLVKRSCFDAILSFDREGGLREALKAFQAECVEVDDEGITLDADERDDFERLSAHARRTKGLAPTLIEELLSAAKTPPHVREHCQAVAELALRMARRLNAAGQCLDSELCRSAAALHDMNRLDQHHSRVAADALRRWGYDAVAQVVAAHDDTQLFKSDAFSESLVVFVADKLVRETERVSLDERYRLALERFPATTQLGQRILRDKTMCQQALARYEELTGDRLGAR